MTEQSSSQSILIHSRPVTDLKFHPDGDVFYASSKDSTASITNIEGKFLGNFVKHEGSISTLDCKDNSLFTASTDLLMIEWDVLTGKPKAQFNIDGVVRGIDYLDNAYFCTDNSMNKEIVLGYIDPRASSVTRLATLSDPCKKIFKKDDYLIFSTNTGHIYKFDTRNNSVVQDKKVHNMQITDTKPSRCRSFFITSSSDSTAKIIDSETFDVMKKFDCEEPINSACIFGTNDKVICVGGINARDVTTTAGKSSFETNFFDIVTAQKIGSYTTHFGTINAVDVHPQGTHYISAGEDGSISLVKMGSDFENAPFTKFN